MSPSVRAAAVARELATLYAQRPRFSVRLPDHVTITLHCVPPHHTRSFFPPASFSALA
jgi:hypothetical protein